MLRLYANLLERLIIMASFLHDNYNADINSCLTHVKKGRSDLPYAVQGYFKGRGVNYPDGLTMKEIISKAGEVLTQSGKQVDGDLIDAIADALQMSTARNLLTGSTLEQLRNVLLLPQEAGLLRTRLAEQRMACADCGIDLESNVLVHLSVDGRGATLRCLRCSGSNVMTPCVSCHEHVSLVAKMMSFLKGVQCDTCKAKKAVALTPPSSGDYHDMPIPTLNTVRPTLATGNAGNRPIFGRQRVPTPAEPAPPTFIMPTTGVFEGNDPADGRGAPAGVAFDPDRARLLDDDRRDLNDGLQRQQAAISEFQRMMMEPIPAGATGGGAQATTAAAAAHLTDTAEAANNDIHPLWGRHINR